MCLNTECIGNVPKEDYGVAIAGSIVTMNKESSIEAHSITTIVDADDENMEDIVVVTFKGKEKKSVGEMRFDIMCIQRKYTCGLIQMVLTNKKINDNMKLFVNRANVMNSLIEVSLSKKVIDGIMKAEAKGRAEAKAKEEIKS